MKYKYLILLLLLPILVGAQMTIDNNSHTDEYLQKIDFSSVFQDTTNGGVWVASDSEGDETRPIQQGRCYEFDGIDDYVDLGDLQIIDIEDSNGDFSLSLYTKKAGSPSSDMGIIGTKAYTALSEGEAGYGIFIQADGSPYVQIRKQAGVPVISAVTSSHNVCDGLIHEIKLGYNASTQKASIKVDSNPTEYAAAIVDLTTSTKSSDKNLTVGMVGFASKYNGSAGNIVIDHPNGGIIHSFHADEQEGVSSFDAVGNTVGIIMHANTVKGGGFHIADNDFYSWQNNIGYSDSTAYVPIKLDSMDVGTGLDINGSVPTYSGRVKYNAQLVNSNVAVFDGTSYLAFTDLTGIDVTSSVGTAIPTKSGNNITFTAGTCSQLTLDNGSIYKFCEGANNQVYDVVNTLHATITSATLATFWGVTDTIRTDNLLDGCDIWIGADTLYVPFTNAGVSIKASGDIIAGYTWVSKNPAGEYHNKAETELKQFLAPALINYDPGFWYTSGVTNPKYWEEIPTNYKLRIFSDKSGYTLDNIGFGSALPIEIYNDSLPSKIEVAQ